ncbi:amidohydrolase [Streptomyces luteolifulvus]|uniref:Amidohydrolase n=1 Tax=Streptomyces luteolifulvus TaxID=2615112 RepID=A0A6H9UPH4_9ACTN|nr:amidohydrolase family protein [Streptomyces luteolifulvus]KAB1139648.1 amidohydrolase [Streptomyces luteolifulvus]
MRRIDLHCYPGTPEWVASQGPFAEALAKYWKKPWVGREEQAVVEDLKAAGLQALLVAFDIEFLTGAPPMSNTAVAEMRDRHPDVFLGAWGAVDPLKGDAAIEEAERAAKSDGVLGFHFHPIMGHFQVDDQKWYPLFDCISGLGLPVMIDVGTTGMGAGLPGGLGSAISHAHPMAVDRLAAQFPDLTIIASHPGFPWVDEMTAVALHKGNVYWELSGWAPKYFPPSLKVDIRARLQDKIMFGTDHPSIPFDRLLREWDELGYSEAVLHKVFHENAERVLGL